MLRECDECGDEFETDSIDPVVFCDSCDEELSREDDEEIEDEDDDEYDSGL